MFKAARQTWDSPDPLIEDEALASTPPRHSRERHTRSRTPIRKHSPAKQTFELDVGDAISPKRIRVTVESEPEYATVNPATQRPISSSSGSGVRLSPTPYYSTPFNPRAMKVKTTTVPLRGLSDSEAENDAPMPVATPARGRGRPRKSAATPIPTKGKRIGTPAAKIAKTKGAETPGTKSRRLSDLLHTGGSSGDNSEEWDFNIPQHITTGRGRSESHARVGPYDEREEGERASSEVPMSSRANKRGRRIGVEGTPSGFGFSYKKPKIGKSRLGKLDFGESQLRSNGEERRSSESIVEPEADIGFGPYDDSSRPSTADSLLNGRHVSSSPPGLDVGGKGYPALTPSQRRSDRRQSMGYQEFSFAQHDDEDLKSSSIGSTGVEEGAQISKPPSPPHTESPAQESDDQWIEPPAQGQRRVSPPVPAHRQAPQSMERDEPPVRVQSPEQQYYDQDALSSSPEPPAQAQRAASPLINHQPIQSPSRHDSPAQEYYDQDSHSSSPALSQESIGAASTAQTSAKPPSPPATQQLDDEHAVEDDDRDLMDDQDWSLTQSPREIPRSPLPMLSAPITPFASHSPRREDREESLGGGAGEAQPSFVEEQQYYDQDSHFSSSTPSRPHSRHSSHSRNSAEAEVPFPSLSPERLHQQIRSASQSLPSNHTHYIPLNDQNAGAEGEGENEEYYEDGEDAALNEFDTIMENEDFTMITADTVPSLLQYFTSPLDPVEHAQIRQEISEEERDLDEEERRLDEEERQLEQEEKELAEAERELERAGEGTLLGEAIPRRRMRESGFMTIVHKTIERSVSHEVRSRSPPQTQEGENGQGWSPPPGKVGMPMSLIQTQEVVEERGFEDNELEGVKEEDLNPMQSRIQIPRSSIPTVVDDLPQRQKSPQQQYYDQDSDSSSPAPQKRVQEDELVNEDDLSRLSPPPPSRQIPRSPPQTQRALHADYEGDEDGEDLSHLSPPPPRREIPRSPLQTQDVEIEVAQDAQEEQYEQDWSLTQSRHEIPRSPLPGQPQDIVEEISFVQQATAKSVSREPEIVPAEREDKQDWSPAQSRHEIPRSPLPTQKQEVVQSVVVEEIAILRSSALLTPDETPSLSRADIAEEPQENISEDVQDRVVEGAAEDVDIWALEASAYNQTRASIQRSSAPVEAPVEAPAEEVAAETPSAEAPKYSWKRASKTSAEPGIDGVHEQEERRSSPVPALKRSLQQQVEMEEEGMEQLEGKASSPVPALKRTLQHSPERQEMIVEELEDGGEDEDVWMAEPSTTHSDFEAPPPQLETGTRSAPVLALKRSLQGQAVAEQIEARASSPVPALKRSLQQQAETQEQPIEEVDVCGEDEDVWMAEASAIHPDPSPVAVTEPAIEHLALPIPNLASPPKRKPRAEPQGQPQTTAAAVITEVTAPPTPVFKRSLQRSQVEIELEEVLQKARKRRSGLPEDWMRQSQGSAFGQSMRTSHSAFDNTISHDGLRAHDDRSQVRDDGNTSFGLTIDGTGDERPSMLGEASILRRETRQREAQKRKLEREAEAQRIRELAASKEAERQRRREERELERRKRAEELEKELQREREEREAKREQERRRRREERERVRDEELNREREERYKFKLAEQEKQKRAEETQRRAEAEKLEAEAKRDAELLSQNEAEQKAEQDKIARESALKAQAEAERQAQLEAERLILEAKRAAEREEARVAELRKQREAAKQRRREERQAELEAEDKRLAEEREAKRLAEVEAENTRGAEEREAQREAELRQEREAAKQRRREERQAELEVEEQRQVEERDALRKAEIRQEMDKENVRLKSERATKRARFEFRAAHLPRPQSREPEIEQSSQKETERLPFTHIPTTAHPISHKVYDHGQEKMSTSYALSPLKVSRKENKEEENPFRMSGQGKRTFKPREPLVDTKQSAARMPKPDFLFDPPSRFVKEKVKEDFEFNPPTQHPLRAFAVSDNSRARGGKNDLFRRQAAPVSVGKGPEMEEVKQQKLPTLRHMIMSVEFDPPYSDGLRMASVSEEDDESEAEDEDNPSMAVEKSVSGSAERSQSRSESRGVSKETSDDESDSESRSDGRTDSRNEGGSITPKAARDVRGQPKAILNAEEYSSSAETSERAAESFSSDDDENGDNDIEVLVDAKIPDAPSLSNSPSRPFQLQRSASISQSDSESNSDEQDENKPPTVDLHGDDDDDDGDEDGDQSMVDVKEDEEEDPFPRFSDSENEIVASTPMPIRGLQAPMRQPLRTLDPGVQVEPESPERPLQRGRQQIEDSDEDSENSDQSQDEEEESQSQSESDHELEVEEEQQRQDRRSTSSLPHAGFRTGNIGAPKSPLKSSLRHPPPLGSPRKNVVFSATTAVSPESSFEESSEVNEGLTAVLDRLAGEDSNDESGSQSLSPSLSHSPSASPTPSVEDQQFEDEEQTELDDRSHLQKMAPNDWAKRHWKALLSIKNQFESDPSAEDHIPDWIQNSPYVDETIWGPEENGSMDLVVEPWMVYVAHLFIETREDEENGSEDWRGEMEEVIKRVYGLVSVERKCAREGKKAPWETPSERVRTFQGVRRRTVERLDGEGRWVEVKPERRGFFGFGTAWL